MDLVTEVILSLRCCHIHTLEQWDITPTSSTLMYFHPKLVSGRWLLALIALALSLTLGLYFVARKSWAPLRPKHQILTKGSSGPDLSTGQLASRAPNLDMNTVVHHGRIIEVEGSTDPGAIVMINGQPAATFFEGNSFKHFIGPVSPGTSIVTITIQNAQGGVTTRQLAVTVD